MYKAGCGTGRILARRMSMCRQGLPTLCINEPVGTKSPTIRSKSRSCEDSTYVAISTPSRLPWPSRILPGNVAVIMIAELPGMAWNLRSERSSSSTKGSWLCASPTIRILFNSAQNRSV